MKYIILPILSCCLFNFTGLCQSNKAYAITGQSGANFNWVDIREIDLSTGNSTKNIFESGKTPFNYTDYNKKTIINNQNTSTQVSPAIGIAGNSLMSSPTESMVAAAAFDQKHSRLFFMPLRGGDLSWLDLTDHSGKATFYKIESSLTGINFSDEANSVTRMAIGADGFGYAITNDGNHLLQFSTSKKVQMKDLGSLLDAEENKGLSVHNKCSSWGGDIVGDVYGNLYLFSAAHNVFVIDVKKRIATYKGTILNLPGTYATNGAAVDKNGSVVVSSANNFEGFYKINMDDLKATKLNTSGQVFNASDLANGNLLFENNFSADVPKLITEESIGNEFVSIYPNPVIGNDCKISFEKLTPGKYNLLITDLTGRGILNKVILLKSGSQVETIRFASKPAAGLYLVKVYDGSNKAVFSDKIVIN